MAKDRKGGSIARANGKEKEDERPESKEQREQEQEQDRATEEARSKRDHETKSKRKKESDSEEAEEEYSSEHGRRKKRKRKDSKRSSRRRRYSDEDSSSSSSSASSPSDSSGSDSDFDSDSEEIETEDERHRRKRKERERRRRRKEKRRIRREKEKEKEKERKKRKKDKKKEKKKKKEVKKGAVTNSWGKYGIIRETDMWNKRPEFTAWLAEVKQVNLEALSNWEEKQMFKEFMEDHNTATFPSKKYYDLDAYHKRKMEKEMKKGSRRGLESERTIFNDEEQRRQELQLAREKLKQQEVETLKRSMQSGLAQAMKEQAQLREEMAYQYKLGNFEAAAAIQRRLDPDVAK